MLELFGNEDDVRTRERDCDVLFFDLCVEIHFFSFLKAKWIHTHTNTMAGGLTYPMNGIMRKNLLGFKPSAVLGVMSFL